MGRRTIRAMLLLLALGAAAPSPAPLPDLPDLPTQDCAEATAPFHAAADVIGDIPLGGGRTTTAPIGHYRTWSCSSIADLSVRAAALEQQVRTTATAQATPKAVP